MERRHSVPTLSIVDRDFSHRRIALESMAFYTPQASNLTHHQKLNEFKDLTNAPMKKERFRPSRRASVPTIAMPTKTKQASNKEKVCKRLDFNEGSSLKRNSQGSYKSSTTTTTCLDDVFSELRFEKHSKRVRFSDSPLALDKPPKSGWRSRYLNLGTPSMSLRAKNFETPLSSLRSSTRTPVSNLRGNIETPLEGNLRMNFETPSSRLRRNFEKSSFNFQSNQQDPQQKNVQKDLFDFRKNQNNNIYKHFPMKSNFFGNSSTDSQNLLKKTLQSTKAAKELDLLLK